MRGLDPRALDALRIVRSAHRPGPGSSLPWCLAGVSAVIGALGILAFTTSSPVAGEAGGASVSEEVPDRVPATPLEPPRALRGGLDASGYLAARRRARIASPVVGRILHLPVRVGDRVAAGSLLAQLDDAAPRARLRKAEADVAATRSALRETEIRRDEAHRVWARQRRLREQGVASAAALEAARSEVAARGARHETQRLSLRLAQREADVWRREVERHRVIAPFAGVVVARNAEEGEVVGPVRNAGRFARDGIVTLVDPESLELEVEVNETEIARVFPGQAAELVLDGYPGDWLEAHVTEIEPAADRRRASIRVWLRIDVRDPRLRPEMGARVRFEDVES